MRNDTERESAAGTGSRSSPPRTIIFRPVAWGGETGLRTIGNAHWGKESQMTVVHHEDIWTDPSDGYVVRVVRFPYDVETEDGGTHIGVQLPHRRALV